MPYKMITQLPDGVKNNLPKHARESRAHRAAWSAVEQKYERNDEGNWVEE